MVEPREYCVAYRVARRAGRGSLHGAGRGRGGPARLLEIRRELTDSRRSFLRSVLQNNQYVRIEVVPYGARETVEGELRELLQRQDRAFEKDIATPGGGRLLGDLYMGDGGAEAAEEALTKLGAGVGLTLLVSPGPSAG